MIYNIMPDGYDVPWNFLDYVMGKWQWYRRWRKGLWWYSDFTEVWWRLKRKAPLPENCIEDYR